MIATIKILYYCLLLLSYCLLFKGITLNAHFAGIVLILAGQCVSATQMIVEELFLKKKNFHPLQVSSLLVKKIKMVFFIDDLHYSLLLGFQPNLIMMPSICCRAMGIIFLFFVHAMQGEYKIAWV